MSEIRIDLRSNATITRCWEPPPTIDSLKISAAEVRRNLRASVRTRIDATHAVSSDLSGGYDSTALCALAAETGPVLGVTAPSRDAASDDVVWARKAAAGISNIEHFILANRDLPLTYAALISPYFPSPDLPSIAVTGRARVLAVAGEAMKRGSRLHLAGHGGDHVISGLPTYFHDSIRRKPATSFARLRDFGMLCGWSTQDLLKALFERRSYRSWWNSQRIRKARDVDAREPSLGWGMPLVVPPWATHDALTYIRDGICEMAESADPVGRRGFQADLESILEGVRTARAIRQIGDSAGITIASPFTDDRVINACLATHPSDRVSARQYKPLLREAMTGIVPSDVLARHTKDDGSIDVVLGLAEHRDELQALWRDSVLAEMGLIDGDYLLRLCRTPSAPELQDGAMYSTIGCELWAKSALGLIKQRDDVNA